MEAYIMDDILIICTIGDISKFYISVETLLPNAADRTFYIRFFAVCSIYLLDRSGKTLNVIDTPAYLTQRIHQHPQITIDRNIITQGHAATDNHDTSHQHKDDSQHIGQKFKKRHIFCPDFSCCKLCITVSIIFLIKFLNLVIFLGESLHHSVTTDIFLNKGIQGGELFTDMLESWTSFLCLTECHGCGKRQDDAHAQSQLPAYREDHDQSEEKQKYIFIDLINNKCYEMSDCIHITCLTAQKITGTLLIIESEVFLEKLAVYSITHGIKNILRTGLEDDL